MYLATTTRRVSMQETQSRSGVKEKRSPRVGWIMAGIPVLLAVGTGAAYLVLRGPVQEGSPGASAAPHPPASCRCACPSCLGKR